MSRQPGEDVKLMLFCDQSNAEAKDDFSPRRGWAQGVLVYERKLKRDCHHVRFICHVEYLTFGSKHDENVIEGGKSREENGNAEVQILSGVERLGSDTKWCLD